MRSSLGDTAAAVGRGLFAGAAGTVAMTVSSTIEAKLRERGSSSAPADAAGKVLGVQPRDEAGKARFSTVVHWAYGTSWGAVRGLLHAAGVDGTTAVAPPPWESAPEEIAIDAFHHAVYAVATGVAFAALRPNVS